MIPKSPWHLSTISILTNNQNKIRMSNLKNFFSFTGNISRRNTNFKATTMLTSAFLTILIRTSILESRKIFSIIKKI